MKPTEPAPHRVRRPRRAKGFTPPARRLPRGCRESSPRCRLNFGRLFERGEVARLLDDGQPGAWNGLGHPSDSFGGVRTSSAPTTTSVGRPPNMGSKSVESGRSRIAASAPMIPGTGAAAIMARTSSRSDCGGPRRQQFGQHLLRDERGAPLARIRHGGFPTAPSLCAVGLRPCVSASTSPRTRGRCRRRNSNAMYPPIDSPTSTTSSTPMASSRAARSSA